MRSKIKDAVKDFILQHTDEAASGALVYKCIIKDIVRRKLIHQRSTGFLVKCYKLLALILLMFC